MNDLVTTYEAAEILGTTTAALGPLVSCKKLVPVGRRHGPGRGAPTNLYRRSDVVEIKQKRDARRARVAELRRELARGAEPGTFNYIPVEEREEPVVLYGLLTASDVAELERRRAKLRPLDPVSQAG